MADNPGGPPQGNRRRIEILARGSPARVAGLIEERRRLERELAEAKKALALGGGNKAEGVDAVIDLGDGRKAILEVKSGIPARDLRGIVDQGKKAIGSGIVAFVTVNEGTAAVAVGVTDDQTDHWDAVELVKVAVERLGGQGGGGRRDMAQGGGPDASKAQEAIDAVREAIA